MSAITGFVIGWIVGLICGVVVIALVQANGRDIPTLHDERKGDTQ